MNRVAIRKRVKGFYKDGRNTSLLRKHELKIDDQFLIDKISGTETKISWDLVGEIIDDHRHIYIMLNSIRTFVILKSTFQDKFECSKFIDNLETVKKGFK